MFNQKLHDTQKGKKKSTVLIEKIINRADSNMTPMFNVSNEKFQQRWCYELNCASWPNTCIEALNSM